MINLNILKLLGKKNSLDKNSHYLGLFLKETEGVGLVMTKKTNGLELVNWQRFKYSNGWENLSQDVDNPLMQFETNLGINLTQTIFFLYSSAINGQSKEVKPIYLKTIKDLTKNLDLKPLGYIEVVDAVIAWLEKKEESSVNTILVEIDRSNLSVFIIRGSKKVNIQTTARTDNIALDVNSTIQEKAGSIILPSRFILYNSNDLNRDIGVLMSHRWDRDLFVQLPRIDLLKEEEMMQALTNLFSSQMVINAKQIPDQQLHHKNKMGFVIGGETTQKKNPENTAERVNKINFRNLFVRFKLPKFNWLIIFGAIISIMALILIELFLHRADLTITLPTQNIEQTMKYSIKENDPNFHKQEITFEISQTKPTNGKKAIGEKAKGEVTIHNFDTTDKTFSKGVTLSMNNIQFVLDDNTKVASATDTLANGNLVRSPGKAKGNITAAEIGSEGNSPKSSRFKIGDYSTNLFFAINDIALTGGSKKEVRTVAKKDLDELENSVLEKAKTEGHSRIEKTLDKAFGYLNNLIDYQITKLTYSKEVGEEASEVNLKSTIVLSYYFYKKNDLNNLAIIALKNKINPGLELDKNKTSLTVTQSEIGENSTNIDLLVKGKTMVFVDKNKLKGQLSGKSVNEIKEVINSNLHAISYALQIEPSFIFIKNRMPWYLNNISIKLNY